MNKKTKNILCTSIIGLSIGSAVIASTVVKGTENPTVFETLDSVIYNNMGIITDDQISPYSLAHENDNEQTFTNTEDSEFDLRDLDADERYYGTLLEQAHEGITTRTDYGIVDIAKPAEEIDVTSHSNYVSKFIPIDDSVQPLNIKFYRTNKGAVTYKTLLNEDDIAASENVFTSFGYSNFGKPSGIAKLNYTLKNIDENPFLDTNSYSVINKTENENDSFVGILENGYPSTLGSEYGVSDEDLEWATAIAILIINNELTLDDLTTKYEYSDEITCKTLINIINMLLEETNEKKYLDIEISSDLIPDTNVSESCTLDTNYSLVEFNNYYPCNESVHLFNLVNIEGDTLVTTKNYSNFANGKITFNLKANNYELFNSYTNGNKVSSYSENETFQLIASATRLSNYLYKDANAEYIVVQPESDVFIYDIPFYQDLIPITNNIQLNINLKDVKQLDNIPVKIQKWDDLYSDRYEYKNKYEEYQKTIDNNTGSIKDSCLEIKDLSADDYFLTFFKDLYVEKEDGYWWVDTSPIATKFTVENPIAISEIINLSENSYSYISKNVVDIDLEYTTLNIQIVDTDMNPLPNVELYVSSMTTDKNDKYSSLISVVTDEDGYFTIEGFNPNLKNLFILTDRTQNTKNVIQQLNTKDLYSGNISIVLDNNKKYSFIAINK